MASSYKPPSAGDFAEIATGTEIRAALAQIAEKGKGIAEGLAPRDSGEYAGSFDVSEETIQWQGAYPGPRAAARVTNTAPYAAAVEFGNEHSPNAQHVLKRTLDALGG